MTVGVQDNLATCLPTSPFASWLGVWKYEHPLFTPRILAYIFKVTVSSPTLVDGHTTQVTSIKLTGCNQGQICSTMYTKRMILVNHWAEVIPCEAKLPCSS